MEMDVLQYVKYSKDGAVLTIVVIYPLLLPYN